ncbi:MAG: hypothetical protein SF052_01405 [Bacteroidia bacterium]|nr:hypothetical protein [Bacteroidia bacterium]
MKTKSTFLLSLLLMATAATAPAQEFPDCERDYSLLQESTQPSPNEIREGAEVYLSRTYLQAVEEGYFDRSPSGLQHWIYVRPASRKELKEPEIPEGVIEKIAKDGNVYTPSRTPSSVHFFQPNDNFEGDYTPDWKDPVMVLPLGLEPVNVLSLNNRLFTIQEKNKDYIRVAVSGKELVFYTGFPAHEDVFDTQRVLDQLSEKQNIAAAALLGKNFRVTHSPNLYYRTRPGGLNHSFDPSFEMIDFTVKDVITNRDEVLLAYQKTNEVLYLVIDKDSDFKLFEMDCISLAQRERTVVNTLPAETVNFKLNELVKKENPADEILKNEGLTAGLYSRFKLQEDGLRGEGSYKYILHNLDEEDTAPCLWANLDEKGEVYLSSQYSSEKGLYHTRIELYIGTREPIISSRIPTLDPRSMRYNKKGLIIEKIRFPLGGDQGIIQAIAQNYDQPIKVRFVAGGSYFQDVELSLVYKEEIRDVYLLSQLIKAKN